jgi:hypothetical protein
MADGDYSVHIGGFNALLAGSWHRWLFGITIFSWPKKPSHLAKNSPLGGDSCLPIIGKKNFLSQPMVFFYGFQKFLAI